MGCSRVQVLPFAVSLEIIFIGDFGLYLFLHSILIPYFLPFFKFFFSPFFFFKEKKKKKSPGCFMFITPANGCCSDDSQSACRGKKIDDLLVVNFHIRFSTALLRSIFLFNQIILKLKVHSL